VTAQASSHVHAHGPAAAGLDRREHRRRLAWTLGLAAVYMLAEVVGGLWTGSLALLADAGHMASDVGALALSLFALWLSQLPATDARTYGYHRVEILAALANGVALVAVALVIVIEAVERLADPPAVLGGPMLVVAAGGLVVNGLGLWILNAGRDSNLNMRGAWLHVLGDALGSVGALTAGALVWAFGWNWADPVASVLIAALVVYASWTLLREAVGVLMEGAPGHIDVEALRRTLARAPGVVSVHDLHVWTITSGMVAMSCHVQSTEATSDPELLDALHGLLREHFGIDHATIQIEPEHFEERGRVC